MYRPAGTSKTTVAVLVVTVLAFIIRVAQTIEVQEICMVASQWTVAEQKAYQRWAKQRLMMLAESNAVVNSFEDQCMQPMHRSFALHSADIIRVGNGQAGEELVRFRRTHESKKHNDGALLATGTLGAANSAALIAFAPTIAVLDEAGQTALQSATALVSYLYLRMSLHFGGESHFSSIAETDHSLRFTDSQQLPPHLGIEGMSTAQAAQHLPTVFSTSISNVVHTTLEYCFRMLPQILDFPSRQYYKGKVKSHSSAIVTNPAHAVLPPLLFLDVRGESEAGFSPRSNQAQTRVAYEVVELLLNVYVTVKKETIKILAFYLDE